jgi:hypothetical protein
MLYELQTSNDKLMKKLEFSLQNGTNDSKNEVSTENISN